MGDQSRSDIHAEAIAKPLKSNSDAIWGTVQKVHCCMPNPGYLLGDPGSCSCFGSLIIIDERCPVKARFGESAALIFLRLDRLVWDLLGRARGRSYAQICAEWANYLKDLREDNEWFRS